MQRFYSNGKLLLSGEYLVLDGATGLALPTAFGQELTVKTNTSTDELHWLSLDDRDEIWFKGSFRLPSLELIEFRGLETVAKTLQKILLKAKEKNTNFLHLTDGINVTTKLEFPRDWGLGSSSTLINNIAQWSNIDPFDLLFESFGGSGYDIACAKIDQPILYQLNHGVPQFERANFDPSFKEHLYFVHLNKKQISSESIKAYKKKIIEPDIIKSISKISYQLLEVDALQDFMNLLKKHESIMSNALGSQTIQQTLFPDFKGQIKSLGAWGGDFVLVCGDESTKSYFIKKGFKTIIPYTSMIKNS